MTANNNSPELSELVETDLINPIDNGLMTQIAPPEIANSMRKINHEILCMDEDEIRKFKRITPTIEKLRMSFWDEYVKAVRKDRNIRAIDIYRSVCSRMQYHMVIQDPHAMSYILKPPMTVINEQKALLLRSHRELWEIMDYPIVEVHARTRKTSINLNLAKLKFEITKFLDERLQGKAVERSIVINKNENDQSLEQQQAEIERMIVREKQKAGIVDVE